MRNYFRSKDQGRQLPFTRLISGKTYNGVSASWFASRVFGVSLVRSVADNRETIIRQVTKTERRER